MYQKRIDNLQKYKNENKTKIKKMVINTKTQNTEKIDKHNN